MRETKNVPYDAQLCHIIASEVASKTILMGHPGSVAANFKTRAASKLAVRNGPKLDISEITYVVSKLGGSLYPEYRIWLVQACLSCRFDFTGSWLSP